MLTAFFTEQPIDEVLIKLLLYFGWIPVFFVLFRGLAEIYKDQKQTEWVGKQPQVLLAIDIPRESEQSPKAVENIFAACMGGLSNPNFKERWFEGKMPRPISFELVSVNGYIQFYIRCNTRHRDLIESALYAQYPDAEIRESEDYVDNVPQEYPDEDFDLHGYEFVLEKPCYFPIRTWVSYEHSLSQELKDPLGVLLEGLSKLQTGEQIWIQYIIEPISQVWKTQGDKYVNETFGIKDEVKDHPAEKVANTVLAVPKAILQQMAGIEETGAETGAMPADMWKAFKVTEQERDIVKAVVQKIAKVGFNTKIRYVYVGRREVFKKGMRNDMIKGFFRQFHHLNLNRFGTDGKVVPKDDYFWQNWSYTARQNNLIQSYKARHWIRGASPSILNTEELATLWHFPSREIKAPMLQKTVSRRAEPPSQLEFATDEEEFELTPKTEESVDLSAEPEGEGLIPSSPEELISPQITGIESPTQPGMPRAEVQMVEDVEPEAEIKKETEQEIETQEYDVPDAIKVLIQPGVELEDIGQNGVNPVEEEDNPPPNLPV